MNIASLLLRIWCQADTSQIWFDFSGIAAAVRIVDDPKRLAKR
jgi:hypothetical protein